MRFNGNGLLAAAVTTVWLSACSDGGAGALPAGNPQAAGPLVEHLSSSGGDSVIQHVVVIIQENRSFDNLFYEYPGADTQSYGYSKSGQKIDLKPVGFQTTWDLGHGLQQFVEDCNGTGSLPGTDCRMNGFSAEYYACGHGSGEPKCPNANPPYSYVPHKETKPYFAIANEFVLADEMFPSNLDASFVSHQYLIAAQADATVNSPDDGFWGCGGPPGDSVPTLTQQRTLGPRVFPCFNYETLADELDNANISWRYYTSPSGSNSYLWSAYQAVKHIYEGPDWAKDVITPQTKFFNDVSSGNLPVISWVTPTYPNSDHSGSGADGGPSWVASLVNAIGESKYWDSTAIFVFWDDWGGWYDHVGPKELDYDGLGIRTAMLVVSAYAKQNYVSHVPYETGSILKFIEQRFGLAALNKSDNRATSPEEDCFDFSQSPRTFEPIPAKYDRNYFLHQRLDLRPVDNE